MIKSVTEGKMILVVDDDDSCFLMYRDFFDGLVTTTNKIGEAIKILQSNNVVLLITDYSMPQFTGVKLATIAREKYHIPVIIVTGYADKIDALRVHADAVLLKPVNLEVLRKVVIQLLDSVVEKQKNTKNT